MRRKLTLFLLLTIIVLGASAQNTRQEQCNYSLYFGWNQWAITTATQRAELAKVLDRLTQQPDATIAVVGWADKSGTERANRCMSFCRAESVKAYLTANGIAAQRITVSGKGVDETAQGNEKARRAEFTLTFFVEEQPRLVVDPTPDPEPVVEKTPEPQPQPEQIVEPTPTKTTLKGWGVGANIGSPFFQGDMVTMSADKTYIGISAGLQGSHRFSTLFAMSIAVDYVRGKTGARDYAKDYLLSHDGMTHYTQTAGTTAYSSLYSKISVVNMGLAFDFNVNRIFSKNAYRHKFNVWLSPTVYAQFFEADIYTKAGDNKFSNGTTKPDCVSLGLGGSMSLRYSVSKSIDLQLKNSLIWITDNKFDGIVTPYGKTQHNAMWVPQIGVIWNINKNNK